MLKKLYKEYLSQFYLARLLRMCVGKTLWAIRWKMIYPTKRALWRGARTAMGLCSMLVDRVPSREKFFSERQLYLYDSASDFVFSVLGKFLNFLVAKIVKPLARLLIPRHIRTRLRSLGSQVILRISGRRRDLKLVALGDVAAAQESGSQVTVFPEGEVACAVPMVFPASLRNDFPLGAESYVFPAVSLVQLENARISGLSNLVELNGEMVHHDLYRFTHDYTSEELHGRVRIYPKRKIIRKFDSTDVLDTLDCAAVFTDACAPNYAHWLTEVLPRIHASAQSGMDEGVPFLIDSGLHANIISSAQLLAGKHSLIEVQRGRSVNVNKLYVAGAAGYIPFDRRPVKQGDHAHGIFSPSALNSMREKLSAMLGLADEDYPKKIMLRRNSGARAMKNEEGLAALLQEQGFSVVYPEKLTFSQQFHLFSGAECVVGATGAAMANLVFCQPSCRVIICLSSHKEHSFGYWRNMASAVGNDVIYVMGPVVGERNQGIHADFVVDAGDVIAAINY